MKRKVSFDDLSNSKHFKAEKSIIEFIHEGNLSLLQMLHPVCDENCFLPDYSINIAAQFNNLEVAKWLYSNCIKQKKHFIAKEYAKINNNKDFIDWLNV